MDLKNWSNFRIFLFFGTSNDDQNEPRFASSNGGPGDLEGIAQQAVWPGGPSLDFYGFRLP